MTQEVTVVAGKKEVKVVIRELKESDLVKGSGFFETLSVLTKAPVISIEKGQEIFKQCQMFGKKIYVADASDNGIVSTVVLMVEPKFIRGGDPVAHIEDVVTQKEWEQNGIATKLMIRAIEEAKKQGCYKVILDCSEENVPFYENLDFEKCEIQMRRDLSS